MCVSSERQREGSVGQVGEYVHLVTASTYCQHPVFSAVEVQCQRVEGVGGAGDLSLYLSPEETVGHTLALTHRQDHVLVKVGLSLASGEREDGGG